jgi:hypothetical protein
MHDDIIRYSLDGQIDDSNVVQSKERLIHHLEGDMRDEGVVPSLDLDPQFTLYYNEDTEQYDFSLTVYGVYVGKEEAWQGAVVTSGKKITKPTPPTKSKAF